jgi:hypothetical protein
VALAAGEQIVRVALENFDKLATGSHRLTAVGLDLWPQSLVYPYPSSTDLELVIAELDLRPGEPDAGALPYAGRSIWMTSFAPNLKHGDGAIELAGQEAAAPATMLQNYGRAQSERFRSFTAHRTLTPIVGIVATAEDASLATDLSQRLKRRFGVGLPLSGGVEPRLAPIGNHVWIGRADVDTAGVATDEEQAAIDAADLAAIASRGRVIIAGRDLDWRRDALDRFVASQGGVVARNASLRPGVNGLMTELYAVERAYFRQGVPACTGVAGSSSVGGDELAAKGAGLAPAVAAIRAAARAGERRLPADAATVAAASAAHCREIRRLARDPFTD